MADGPDALAGLPRRIALTYRHHGIAGLARHTVMFPLRLTGLDRALGLGTGPRHASAAARRWYRDHGRPVTIVIPSFRDAALVTRLAAQIRSTTPADRVSIIVADDASGPEHLAALARIEGIEVIAGETNGGFAVNVNRGIRAADPTHDVVLLNSDVTPLRDWLACLQHAVSGDRPTGIAGAKLLYPDNRIQYAGTIRNAAAPEWFDHRYRGKPADWGPADVGARRSPPPARACTSGATSSTPLGCLTRRMAWATRTSTTACARGERVTRWPTFRPRACITASPRPGGPSKANVSYVRSASSGSAGRRSLMSDASWARMAACASSTSPRGRSSVAATATSSSTSTA